MRTTWNLPAEVLTELKSLARSQKQSVTAVATDVLRDGLLHRTACRPRRRYREKTFPGRAMIDVTKATQLAYELDDEETVRKMREEW